MGCIGSMTQNVPPFQSHFEIYKGAQHFNVNKPHRCPVCQKGQDEEKERCLVSSGMLSPSYLPIHRAFDATFKLSYSIQHCINFIHHSSQVGFLLGQLNASLNASELATDPMIRLSAGLWGSV
jgi:hypothetical protein